MADGENAETREILRDVEDATDDGICRSTVVEATATHLDPTGTQSEVLGLILHGDGGDGTVFHPTVILQRIAQHDNGYGGILEELRTEILRIGKFLENCQARWLFEVGDIRAARRMSFISSASISSSVNFLWLRRICARSLNDVISDFVINSLQS